jgi:hypothetical protein
MWRFVLAIKCFFLVLFARRLPADARALLPAEPATAAPVALPPPTAEIVEKPKPTGEDGVSRGAIALLGLLQREGRLVDFLEEDIDSFTDAQVGAAVRDIHRGCRKAVREHVAVEPILRDPENARVHVEPGFDPGRIRLVGNVAGAPPFTGTLKHPGWRGASVKLAAPPGDPTVIAPAEVEL